MYDGVISLKEMTTFASLEELVLDLTVTERSAVMLAPELTSKKLHVTQDTHVNPEKRSMQKIMEPTSHALDFWNRLWLYLNQAEC